MGQKENISGLSSEELIPPTSNTKETIKNLNDIHHTNTEGLTKAKTHRDGDQKNKINGLKPLKAMDVTLVKDGSHDVDRLVIGIKECCLEPKGEGQVDVTTQDLSERLVQLDLAGDDAEKESKKVIVTRRHEPEEDDESETPASKQKAESEKSVVEGDGDAEGEKITMVKLEAPKEDEDTLNGDSESDALTERSPAGGIPVYHNQNHSHVIGPYPATAYNGVCLPRSQNAAAWNKMPDNYFAQVKQQPIYDPGIKGKRGRNDLDIDEDASKYFRPLSEAQLMMSAECGLNNLNAPGQPTTFKSINQVCARQMSGGTVYTSVDDTNANECKQVGESLDSLELQEAFNLFASTGGEGDIDIDELLQQDDSDEVCLSQTPSMADQTYPLGCQQHLNMPPQHQQQQPMPSPASYIQQQQTIIAPYDVAGSLTYKGSKMFQQKNFVHPGMSSPGRKIGPPSEDHGYNSDMSPTREEESPLILGSSPPDQNLSPPPSNMSVQSHDSGIYSPSAEDGAVMQIKSPHSVQMTSPESISNLYLLDNAHTVQQQGSPTMSPPQCQDSSLQTSLQMASVAAPQPYAKVAPFQQSAITSSPPYPHQNQMRQLPSLASYEDANNFSSPYVSDNLLALSDALAIVTKDLESCQRHKLNLRDTAPQQQQPEAPVNIPSTVPQDITSPSFYQGPPYPTFPGQTTNGLSAAPATPSPCNTTRKANNNNLVSKKPTAQVAPVAKMSPGKESSAPCVLGKFVSNGPVTIAASGQVPMGHVTNSDGPPVATTTVPPVVNSEGKIAIPASRPRASRTVPVTTAPVPVFITSNGLNGLTPVLVVPKEPKPRYAPIAPKAPNKPSKPVEFGPANATVTGQSAQDKAAKPSTSKKDKLNFARRSVAGVERKDLLYSDPEGDTHLHVAVCQTDENLIEALIERLVREELQDKINAQNAMQQTPMYLAVCENKPEMVEVLVRYGAGVKHLAEATLDDGTVEKSAAIHRASSKGEGHLKTLKALLQSPDIDLNQMNSEGHTALHCAIFNHGKVNTDNKVINSIPIIQALMPAGADPNLKIQKNGKTALMFALESRNVDLIECVFGLVEPAKLTGYLKTESFDSINCHKIFNSMKPSLSNASQQRLGKCLKPGSHRIEQ